MLIRTVNVVIFAGGGGGGEISRKCGQDLSGGGGGNFHDTTHISFKKSRGFYFPLVNFQEEGIITK